MNKQVPKNERLSALIDGETDDFETRRLLDELARSEVDRGLWERYHLIGDSLRGGMQRMAPAGFMNDVHKALDAEPALTARPSLLQSRWLKPVAGTGVAAAMAMVTLAGMQMLGDEPGGDPGVVPMAVETGAPADIQTASTASTDGEAEPGSGEGLDPRFARYLENHAELTGPGSAALGQVRYSMSDE
ncbi:MAG: sigma-E factor negative regulatory protein [Pseudomonadota bacterium]